MDRSRNPIVEVHVLLQLIQYAIGGLDEHVRSAQVHVWQEEEGQ